MNENREEWHNGTIQANGINIHYYRTGGEKPPLLLLHGITDNGLCWTRVAGDLQHHFDIIMTDARGHGGSEGISSGFSISLLAEDAAGVIQGLGLEQPVVWGHSMGAITAAALAAKNPNLVKLVILEDPPLGDIFSSLPPEIIEGIKQENLAVRAMTAEERLAWAVAQNPGWHPAEISPWIESKVQYDLRLMGQFGAFRGIRWQEVFERMACPGLLLTADPAMGAIVGPETARQAVELWKGGRLVQIAGAGHSIHRERYEEVMLAIKEYFKLILSAYLEGNDA